MTHLLIANRHNLMLAESYLDTRSGMPMQVRYISIAIYRARSRIKTILGPMNQFYEAIRYH